MDPPPTKTIAATGIVAGDAALWSSQGKKARRRAERGGIAGRKDRATIPWLDEPRGRIPSSSRTQHHTSERGSGFQGVQRIFWRRPRIVRCAGERDRDE